MADKIADKRLSVAVSGKLGEEESGTLGDGSTLKSLLLQRDKASIVREQTLFEGFFNQLTNAKKPVSFSDTGEYMKKETNENFVFDTSSEEAETQNNYLVTKSAKSAKKHRLSREQTLFMDEFLKLQAEYSDVLPSMTEETGLTHVSAESLNDIGIKRFSTKHSDMTKIDKFLQETLYD
ncbi:hypothetical protein DPMN_115421 [Dreissena polymorpha]|uniref:Uncharacterized protein n=1 Tax=Dreissena polymorpha TaxID=45954 RepID=A0A9D4QSM0_DREPO|nr:hypothetical protein DPMN_115421 [Dreissena polymorpha]